MLYTCERAIVSERRCLGEALLRFHPAFNPGSRRSPLKRKGEPKGSDRIASGLFLAVGGRGPRPRSAGFIEIIESATKHPRKKRRGNDAKLNASALHRSTLRRLAKVTKAQRRWNIRFPFPFPLSCTQHLLFAGGERFSVINRISDASRANRPRLCLVIFA